MLNLLKIGDGDTTNRHDDEVDVAQSEKSEEKTKKRKQTAGNEESFKRENSKLFN